MLSACFVRNFYTPKQSDDIHERIDLWLIVTSERFLELGTALVSLSMVGSLNEYYFLFMGMLFAYNFQ